MTPQVPGALKLPFVAALALALVLPASAIDGSVVGTSCHREATACDANAECSTCRGGLERGMLATECQGYSGLLDPRRSFCKVLEASYCCNVGESGQTQACLAEDLIMEYLECLLGGRECSTIEDMPCYGEESRASVPRELSAAGEDEVSSVDAGYVEDSGSSPSPSYPLTTTPGPTSQLKFFTSATGSPTSMAVGLEGGLGTGVVKGTLSAMGVPMSLIDEVGEKVAVQEETLSPAASVLGVDVENLSFDNLRYFQGAESEVSITVNPEFLVDQDEIGGGTTTGVVGATGDAETHLMAKSTGLGEKKSPLHTSGNRLSQSYAQDLVQLYAEFKDSDVSSDNAASDFTRDHSKAQTQKHKMNPLFVDDSRNHRNQQRSLPGQIAEGVEVKEAVALGKSHESAAASGNKDPVASRPSPVQEKVLDSQTRCKNGSSDERPTTATVPCLPASTATAARQPASATITSSRPHLVEGDRLGTLAQHCSVTGDGGMAIAVQPGDGLASTATAARQPASATITSSRPHLVEGDRLGTLAQHCSVTGDGGMAIAVQPGDGLASTATAARQPASATITSSRPHLVGGDRLGTLAQHCSVTGDRGMAIAVQPGDGLDLTAAKTTVASVDRPGSTGRRSPDGRGREAGAAVWGSPAIAHDRATRTPNGAHQQQTRDWGEAIEAAAKSVLDENGANGARPAPVEAYEALTANAAGVQDADSERFPSPLRDDVTNDNPLDPTEPQEQTIGVAVVQVYGSSKTGGFGGRGYREGSRKGERPTTPNRRSAPSPIRVFATAPRTATASSRLGAGRPLLQS
ncbi:hypothetical protein Esi_0130_0078 [Ectocarpus siliculosus]|uniref:Uncharacterized protein n=1 Tax=Ectocarpus siliculosus TaxID=2880 RepID=D7FJB8_ECTSI|nr:hypothetical protein Esi_0130_0078 [Ectocarpus siliculosus]|eukprot:CBJ29024.1 hypothetical protein Esi_0130_0078 [Ectocarpus siliculosus]